MLPIWLKELEIRPAMEKVFEARIPNYSSNKVAALAERSVLLWPEQLPADLPDFDPTR